ncbi:ATP-binding cassette domain-containing protein [Bdellovibrio sp. SKB1291214]|uniref:ATP-binding cassette domain-containing protein n=1 Tax=Bdellovibrio sp. SKB1291214 TaxID=1732569 RepID=UPI000B5154FF|nr:ATP-binding cassette domain-containing protein [Bdellovibrio sp. SKB1291214]UYL08765.1 ATP-binding cassette domain-containing protein [Bdellovibrio sp. SKB1291214]
MKKLLSVSNLQALSKSGTKLSPAVNFDLHSGEILFLRGENGAGKSTILKTLLKLHGYYSGKFEFAVKNQEIEYLPQLGNLNFHLPLTLGDMLGAQTHSPLLAGLDLNKKWNTASGGERQKILFSAALAKKPKVLILDEPFNHVDKDAGHLLEQGLIQFLNQNPDSALILVSHRTLTNNDPRMRFLEIQ